LHWIQLSTEYVPNISERDKKKESERKWEERGIRMEGK
jgi:hypothetical protein